MLVCSPSCLPLLLCCLCFLVAFVAAEAVALLVLVALAGLSPCCSCAAPSAFWLFAASGKGDSGNKQHVNNKDPSTRTIEKTNVCSSETAKFSDARRTWAQGRKQTNSSRAAPLFFIRPLAEPDPPGKQRPNPPATSPYRLNNRSTSGRELASTSSR